MDLSGVNPYRETAVQEGDGRVCLPCEKAWHAGCGPRVLIQRLRAAIVHERSFHGNPQRSLLAPIARSALEDVVFPDSSRHLVQLSDRLPMA